MNVLTKSLLVKLNIYPLKVKNITYCIRYALLSRNVTLRANNLLMQQLFRPHRTIISHFRSIHALSDVSVTKVSTAEIKRMVKTHFRQCQEGHTCISIDCPSCQVNHKNTGSLGKLCINLKTGYSFCTHCYLQGPWTSFESYLKSFPKPDIKQHAKTSMISIFHVGIIY